eukprot:106602_1
MCFKSVSFRNILLFLASWSIFCHGYFLRNSIAPITDVLEHDLHTTAGGVGILGSSIHFCYFMPQIPYGILLNFVSAKYVMPISAIILSIAMLMFSFTTNIIYGSIILSLGGLACAPAWLCFVQMVDDIFTRSQVPFAIGIQMTLTYTFLFVGNYIQAYIYTNYGEWRITFIVLAIGSFISAIIFSLLTVCNRETHHFKEYDNEQDFNEISLKKMKYSTTDQTKLLSNSKFEIENNYKMKLKEIGNSLKIATCFKWNWILSLWGFSGLVLVNAFIGMWFISYMMIKYSYSRSTAALISGSFYLMRATSAPIIGTLAMRSGKRVRFLIIGSLCWLCTIVIIYWLDNDVYIGFVIGLNIISGLGGGAWGIMWTLQREYNAYYKCKDTAAGLVNTLQNSSGFIGQLFIGEMLDLCWSLRDGKIGDDGDRIYTVQDYNYALIIIPVVIGLAIFSACILKETNAQNLDFSHLEHRHKTHEIVTK